MRRPAQRCPLAVVALAAAGVLPGCGENGAPDDDLSAVRPPEIVRILPAPQALENAHIPTLDPATMHEAEIRKALKDGPRCDFRYTSTGKAVLAVARDANGKPLAAVVKLNGHLITLNAAGDQTERLLMVADPVRISVAPDTRGAAASASDATRREADMVFEVGQRLKAGYRGYLDCAADPAALRPPRRR